MRNTADLFVVTRKNLLKKCAENAPKTASNRGFGAAIGKRIKWGDKHRKAATE